MENKKYMRIAVIVATMVAICCLPMVFACNHEMAEKQISVPATCIEDGREDWVCLDCGAILKSRVIEASGHAFVNYEAVNEATCVENGLEMAICENCHVKTNSRPIKAIGHSFEAYRIIVFPTPNKNGMQAGTCDNCGEVFEIEYICPHETTSMVVVEHPTCLKNGLNNEVCDFCGTVINEYTTDIVSCSYGDWTYVKYADPLNNGERYLECGWCGNRISETYEFEMPGANSIYIPNAGICNKFTTGSFTQGAVDAYDLVYTYGFDASNPFIIGHRYGTMKNLHRTRVGQYLYVSKDGVIETYKVVISEFAMQNADWTDIIGQSTGYSIWDSVGSKTLHMYTCYGGENGRWMVLARLVS